MKDKKSQLRDRKFIVGSLKKLLLMATPLIICFLLLLIPISNPTYNALRLSIAFLRQDLSG